MAESSEAELAGMRAQLKELKAQQATEEPRPAPGEMPSYLALEIKALERRIRETDPATRDDPELQNPDALAENMSLFEDSEDVRNAQATLRWQAGAKEREAKAATEAAKAKAAQQLQDAQMGPTERELRANLPDPTYAQVDTARGKDASIEKTTDMAQRQGCITPPKVLAAAGIGIAVVIAIIILVMGGSDDTKPVQTANGGAGAPTPGGGGGGGDLSNFAGHYVMDSGLDDPSGLDVHNTGGRPAPDSIGPSTSTIDIDANGNVTGGSIHVSGVVTGCKYTMDATTAKGNVTASATGMVIFDGNGTESGECQEFSYPIGRAYQFGITDTGLFMCRSNMATTNTCAAEYPRLVAHFVREGP